MQWFTEVRPYGVDALYELYASPRDGEVVLSLVDLAMFLSLHTRDEALWRVSEFVSALMETGRDGAITFRRYRGGYGASIDF